MEFHNVPGLSIAVIENYKIAWARGYGWGDKEEHYPVTAKTLFQAASISKSLNAAGFLKLAQDKKINLRDDINNYLTTWKFPYDSLSGGQKISILNLLSHTSGTTVHGFPGYSRDDTLPSVIQILDGKAPSNTAPVRSQFQPGKKVQYSGGGTVISQLIVTNITQKPYDFYMKEAVLKPFDMVNSFYSGTLPDVPENLLASGYRGNGEKIAGRFHIYPEQAAAGLWTNPTDLSKFIIETQLSYTGNSNNVLSKEMTTKMLTPFLENSGAGLGVFISKIGDYTYFQHGGANEGFRCQYFGSLKDGKGVVVMVNSDNGAILQEIINSVATVYQWEGFYNPVVKKTISLSDEVLERYVGEYRLSPRFSISITKVGNALQGKGTGQSAFDLYPETKNKFFLKAMDVQIEFIEDDNFNISKLILHQNGQSTEGKKVQ